MYVSINFKGIDQLHVGKLYIVHSVLMNTRLHFYCGYTLRGDWEIIDLNPKCILTEKLNAKIN